MFDLKWIRDNPDAFNTAMGRRGLNPQAKSLLSMDADKRDAQTRAQKAQAERNTLSKQIGQAKARGEDAAGLIKKVGELKTLIETEEDKADQADRALKDRLLSLPNIPDERVPDGEDEADNRQVRDWGDKPGFDFKPKEHFELGEALGQMDFEAAARLSGARFVVLSGALARLERALGQFMLNMHAGAHGYTEMQTPALVWADALTGTGQLPKFADDLFRTTGDHWLIPTAEVTLTNLNRGRIVAEGTLPHRMAALTPCFRAEAGAAGRDTRGMIRQHQFSKVELVSVTTPEDSEAEHERMTGAAEAVLKALKLPYRVVELCTGDLGFSARRTYDLEVWLPGQDAYREISSCSNCGDFQARRMNMRCREGGAEGQGTTRFPHTLNGSGVAVGRALVAVMENYQTEAGTIRIPEVLWPFMDGLKEIEPAS